VRPRQLRHPRRPGHLVPDRRRVRQCLFGGGELRRGSGGLHLLDRYLRRQHTVRRGRCVPGDPVEREHDSRQLDHLRRQRRRAPDDGASLGSVCPAGTGDGGPRPATERGSSRSMNPSRMATSLSRRRRRGVVILTCYRLLAFRYLRSLSDLWTPFGRFLTHFGDRVCPQLTFRAPQSTGACRRGAITLQRGVRREPSDRPLGLPPMSGGGLSALPAFGFAGACLVTWFRPTAFGDRMVHHIAMVMLLEFFVVHSAGFMGVVAASDQPRARRLLLMLGLAGLYTVFTASYSVGF